MFDEIPIMASRGLAKVLLCLLLLLHCFIVLFLISSYHSILGVAWALGMKKCTKSQGHWHKTRKFGPQSLEFRPMRVNSGLWSLSFPWHESNCGLRDLEQ